MNHQHWILASSLALVIAIEANAAANGTEQPVVKIERFATCRNCPAYELGFYSNGGSYFIGRDGVRTLGVAGSVAVFNRAHALGNDDISLHAPISWSETYNKDAVEALLSEFSKFDTWSSSTGCRDALQPPPFPLLKLTVNWRNKKFARSFCYAPDTPIQVRHFIDNIESLYEFPKDKLTTPYFHSDRTVVMRFAITYDKTPDRACGMSPDMVVLLKEDGTVLVSGQRYPALEPINHYPTIEVEKFRNRARELIGQARHDLDAMLRFRPTVAKEVKIVPLPAGQEGLPRLGYSLQVKRSDGSTADLTENIRTWWLEPAKMPKAFEALREFTSELKEILPSEYRDILQYCKTERPYL